MARRGTEAFPNLGAHCDEPDCYHLDFLPLECDGCGGFFCAAHRAYRDHSRAKAAVQGRTVMGYPDCGDVIERTGQQQRDPARFKIREGSTAAKAEAAAPPASTLPREAPRFPPVLSPFHMCGPHHLRLGPHRYNVVPMQCASFHMFGILHNVVIMQKASMVFHPPRPFAYQSWTVTMGPSIKTWRSCSCACSLWSCNHRLELDSFFSGAGSMNLPSPGFSARVSSTSGDIYNIFRRPACFLFDANPLQAFAA